MPNEISAKGGMEADGETDQYRNFRDYQPVKLPVQARALMVKDFMVLLSCPILLCGRGLGFHLWKKRFDPQ